MVLSLSPGLGPDGLPSPGGYHFAPGGAMAFGPADPDAAAGAILPRPLSRGAGAVGGGGRRGSPAAAAAACANELVHQLAIRSTTGEYFYIDSQRNVSFTVQL